MENIASYSLQARLIRQMQAADGQTVCYAAASSEHCLNKTCCWRHDCFDETLDIRFQREKGGANGNERFA